MVWGFGAAFFFSFSPSSSVDSFNERSSSNNINSALLVRHKWFVSPKYAPATSTPPVQNGVEDVLDLMLTLRRPCWGCCGQRAMKTTFIAPIKLGSLPILTQWPFLLTPRKIRTQLDCSKRSQDPRPTRLAVMSRWYVFQNPPLHTTLSLVQYDEESCSLFDADSAMSMGRMRIFIFLLTEPPLSPPAFHSRQAGR